MNGDGPAPERSWEEALEHVGRLLRAAGVTDEEIGRAVEDDVLDLLTVDRLVLPAGRRYDQAEVAARTGVPVELLRRFWRALGFLDVPEGERAFTDLDVQAVELLRQMVGEETSGLETLLQLARVTGASMARIADAAVGPDSPMIAEHEDSVRSAAAFADVADNALPVIARLLEFVWRRHVQAAARRAMLARSRARAGESPEMAVGFADMVGFTLLSQHLTEEELAAVVRRFEDISYETVTGLGGRVVKMIGDEVMFVVDDVAGAARIGLSLAEAYADDDLLSDVRVGLAVGPVLAREGDFYGTAVNLAHRIVNIANPGTVLVSDQLYRELSTGENGEFAGRPLRPRELKGVGRVQLWWLGRAGQDFDGAGSAADRRRNRRWERLAEVLRELEELREVGERLFVGRRRGYPAETSYAGTTSGADGASSAAGGVGSAAGKPDGGDTEGP